MSGEAFSGCGVGGVGDEQVGAVLDAHPFAGASVKQGDCVVCVFVELEGFLGDPTSDAGGVCVEDPVRTAQVACGGT